MVNLSVVVPADEKPDSTGRSDPIGPGGMCSCIGAGTVQPGWMQPFAVPRERGALPAVAYRSA